MKYRGVEQLEARRAHNPEVVGSSPASATIKVPKTTRFSELFFYFNAEKLELNFCIIPYSHPTHILTHNRISPSGQVSIFQNTMATKLKISEIFKTFEKMFSTTSGFLTQCSKLLPLLLQNTAGSIFCYEVV